MHRSTCEYLRAPLISKHAFAVSACCQAPRWRLPTYASTNPLQYLPTNTDNHQPPHSAPYLVRRSPPAPSSTPPNGALIVNLVGAVILAAGVTVVHVQRLESTGGRRGCGCGFLLGRGPGLLLRGPRAAPLPLGLGGALPLPPLLRRVVALGPLVLDVPAPVTKRGRGQATLGSRSRRIRDIALKHLI
jgi:hypothetical protein